MTIWWNKGRVEATESDSDSEYPVAESRGEEGTQLYIFIVRVSCPLVRAPA